MYLSYAIFLLPVLGSARIFPAHDNFKYHFLNYLYFSNSLVHGYGFPLWYPDFGGVPVGVTSVNMFPFLPFRIIGYLLYGVTAFNPVTLYKLTLIIGMLIVITGWWLFLTELTLSRISATLASLLILFGGSGFTVFHQEQIIATMTWIPWILWMIMRLPRDSRGIFVLPILCGLAMSVHYPQIQLVTLFLVFAVLLILRKINKIKISLPYPGKPALALAVILFVLAASPVFYVNAVMKQDFSSPLRASEDIGASSMADYLRLNRQQYSSARLSYFGNYVRPDTNGWDDGFAFYVTLTGLFFAGLGLLLRWKRALPVTVILLGCAWATLGINGFSAQFLYFFHFPFIKYFRQWYHFVPMVNFCLSALAGLGFCACFEYINNSFAKGARVIIRIIFALLVMVMFIEARPYLRSYINKKLITVRQEAARLSNDDFIFLIKKGWFSRSWLDGSRFPPLVVYKPWFKAVTVCPQVVSGPPYFSSHIYNDLKLSEEQKSALLLKFCNPRCLSGSVVAALPATRGVILENSDDLNKFNSKDNQPNLFLPAKEYKITPKGVKSWGEFAQEGMLVFPFAYPLKLKAYLNSRPVMTYPVYGGALTGVWLSAGKFDLELRLPFSWYEVTLIIQAILFLLVLLVLAIDNTPAFLYIKELICQNPR